MENHRVYKRSHTLVYTKNGVACGAMDNPDRVEILVNPMSSTITFDANSRDMARVCQMLEDAFDRGQFAKAEEVCKALNIKNI